MCELVKSMKAVYLSPHLMGKAIDFTIGGLTAEQGRKLIIDNANLFPCNIRLEDGVSWIHFDVQNQHGSNAKVYLFKA
jgi:hypothetical protein